MNPLNVTEVEQIDQAVKHGFLSDDLAVELLKNPNAARAYLEAEPFETN